MKQQLNSPNSAKMEINYRRFYHRVKRRYPAIERQINEQGQISSLDEIPALYERFKRVTSANDDDIRKNTDNVRHIFVAVITRMEDPLFFTDNAPVRRGLRMELAKLLGCDQTIISHGLRSVKNYMDVYPEFCAKVEYFYGKMTE